MGGVVTCVASASVLFAFGFVFLVFVVVLVTLGTQPLPSRGPVVSGNYAVLSSKINVLSDF